MIAAYEEIVDLIAAGATQKEVIDYRPSNATKERVADLIHREKVDELSADETAELNHYLEAEHIMRLAKARAHERRVLALSRGEGNTMTPKERLRKLVENIPDNASREEVLYRLRFFHSVELGCATLIWATCIDDDDLDELLEDEAKGNDSLVEKVSGRFSGGRESHSSRQTKSSPKVRQGSKKIREGA